VDVLLFDNKNGDIIFFNLDKHDKKIVSVPSNHKQIFRRFASVAGHKCSSDIFMVRRDNPLSVVGWNRVTQQAWDLPPMNSDHVCGQIELLNVLVCQKSLVVVGGTNNNFVEEFLFEDNVWKNLASMKQSRGLFASVLVEQNNVNQNHVFVMGGCNFSCNRKPGDGMTQTTSCVEMYCKQTNKWTTLKSMCVTKCDLSGTVHQEKVVAGQGEEYGTNDIITWFDFHKQDWFEVVNYPGYGDTRDGHMFVGTTDVFCVNETFLVVNWLFLSVPMLMCLMTTLIRGKHWSWQHLA